MKLTQSFRFAAAGLLSALSLAAVAMPSSDGGECPMSDMPGEHSMHHGAPMGLHQLKLSEAQHDKVFELMQGQAKQRHELMRASRKNMEQLRELERAPTFDAAKVRALADEQGKLMAQQMFEHAQMKAQMRALLTPEQLKQLDERPPQPPRGEGMGPGGKRDKPQPRQ